MSDERGARVEGKEGMRAKVERPCKGARVKGMERFEGNVPQEKTAESDSKNFIAEHRAGGALSTLDSLWGHFGATLGSL